MAVNRTNQAYPTTGGLSSLWRMRSKIGVKGSKSRPVGVLGAAGCLPPLSLHRLDIAARDGSPNFAVKLMKGSSNDHSTATRPSDPNDRDIGMDDVGKRSAESALQDPP